MQIVIRLNMTLLLLSRIDDERTRKKEGNKENITHQKLRMTT